MRTLTSERALLHNRNLLIKTWAVRLALSYTLSLIETRRDLFFASHWHWNRVFFSFRSPQLVVSRTFTFFTSHLPLNDSAIGMVTEHWSEVLNVALIAASAKFTREPVSCYESWRRRNNVCRYLIASRAYRWWRCRRIRYRKIQLAGFFGRYHKHVDTRNRGAFNSMCWHLRIFFHVR